MSEQEKTSLRSGRRQTDESLTVERGRADESFETYREKTESDTDKAVSETRLEADRARRQRRSHADVGRSSANANVVSQTDQDANELHLRNERNSEDSAIEKEREKNDMALELERGEKERLLNNIVSAEREATDKNLSGERANTDFETERAAKLLTFEKEAHLTTKSALTTRDEFVAIVSHDLRNPIGAILSSVEVLVEDASINKFSEDSLRSLAIIKRCAETSLRLISDILDMERIVGGKLSLTIAPYRIGELLRDAVESHAYAARPKRIELRASVTCGDCLVNCDKDRVGQILSNLIGNALKFTPEGGVITVAAQEGESAITVSVTDTGPGIPVEQQSRIFERFAQIGNKGRSGLGLGLYISKTLVESHQGKLWVNSAVGRGSSFCFTLLRA